MGCRFNINHSRTPDFNKVQQRFECGSGPGGLPGSPHVTPENQHSEEQTLQTRSDVDGRCCCAAISDRDHKRLSVEPWGFHRYKNRTTLPGNSSRQLLELLHFKGRGAARASGFAPGVQIAMNLCVTLCSISTLSIQKVE